MTLRPPPSKNRHSIVLSLLAGAITMLITNLLTGSIGLGWVAFVVATVTAGALFWRAARSRAAASDEQDESSATKTSAPARAAVPMPLEIIHRSVPETRVFYEDTRPTMAPEFAARSALGRALEDDVRSQVLAYYDGELDHVYGVGSGSRVRAALVESLEATFEHDSSAAAA